MQSSTIGHTVNIFFHFLICRTKFHFGNIANGASLVVGDDSIARWIGALRGLVLIPMDVRSPDWLEGQQEPNLAVFHRTPDL